jgi:hypothetical protein
VTYGLTGIVVHARPSAAPQDAGGVSDSAAVAARSHRLLGGRGHVAPLSRDAAWGGAPTPTSIGPASLPASRPDAERSPAKAEGTGALHPAARKLLTALAQHAPARFIWGQAATLAGLKPSGGHYNAGRKQLRDMDLRRRDIEFWSPSALPE